MRPFRYQPPRRQHLIPSTWIRPLAVGACLAMLLSACGDSTVNSGMEMVGGAEPEMGGAPIESSVVDPSQEEVTITNIDTQRVAPQTERDVSASPADRQRSQVVVATPPAPRSEAESVAASSSAETPSSGERSSSNASGEALSQTESTVPQRDIPNPARGQSASVFDQAAYPDAVFETQVPRWVNDPRILEQVGAESYTCQPGVDAECTDVEDAPDGSSGVSSVVAPSAELSELETEQLETKEIAPSEPPVEDICPDMRAPECGGPPIEDPVRSEVEVGVQPGVSDEAEPPDCEAIPWARGCDGPPIDEADSASFETDAETSTDNDAEASRAEDSAGPDPDDAIQDPGEGVDVPAEIVEILLTPAIDTDEVEQGDEPVPGDAEPSDPERADRARPVD